MKHLSPGIWLDKIDHATITVNENANSIGVLFENGKSLVVPYSETPTIADFEIFRNNVIKSCEVFKRLATD